MTYDQHFVLFKKVALNSSTSYIHNKFMACVISKNVKGMMYVSLASILTKSKIEPIATKLSR